MCIWNTGSCSPTIPEISGAKKKSPATLAAIETVATLEPGQSVTIVKQGGNFLVAKQPTPSTSNRLEPLATIPTNQSGKSVSLNYGLKMMPSKQQQPQEAKGGSLYCGRVDTAVSCCSKNKANSNLKDKKNKQKNKKNTHNQKRKFSSKDVGMALNKAALHKSQESLDTILERRINEAKGGARRQNCDDVVNPKVRSLE